MGGCWGANLKATLAREKWKTTWRGMLKDSNMWAARKSHGPDQQLLKKHAWKIFEGPVNTHQHDAFNCQRFNGSLPWPTQRLHGPWNFVGAHAGIKSVGKKCPMSCRPESHKDWEYCWFWNSMLKSPHCRWADGTRRSLTVDFLDVFNHATSPWCLCYATLMLYNFDVDVM